MLTQEFGHVILGAFPSISMSFYSIIANKNLAITIKFTDHKFRQISIYEHVNYLHLFHHQWDNTIHYRTFKCY